MPEEVSAKHQILTRRVIVFGALAAGLYLAAAMPANAQYLGLNLRGDTD